MISVGLLIFMDSIICLSLYQCSVLYLRISAIILFWSSGDRYPVVVKIGQNVKGTNGSPEGSSPVATMTPRLPYSENPHISVDWLVKLASPVSQVSLTRHYLLGWIGGLRTIPVIFRGSCYFFEYWYNISSWYSTPYQVFPELFVCFVVHPCLFSPCLWYVESIIYASLILGTYRVIADVLLYPHCQIIV